MGQPVMKWQVLAKDPDTFLEFYRKLFGWSVTSDNAMGYREINTDSGRGIDGGVWPSPPEAPSMVSLYVEVENVDASAQAAADLGGTIVIPPQTLPDGDRMAVIVGPEGIPFGLMQTAPRG